MSVATLTLSGSPFEFGYEHGRKFAPAIRRYAKERVRLATEPGWTGRTLPASEVLTLAQACVEHHRDFSPTLFEELEGLAAATELTLAELVIAGGFTDFVDAVYSAGKGEPALHGINECTAFLVPAGRMSAGGGMLAQTWDMHEGSTENLVLLSGRPAAAPAFRVFTTAGALGMIGMNEAGLAVGINNLMGGDGRPGVTWPFVVREMLTKETVKDALDVLQRAPLAGAHNYLLMDATGAGANVEAMSSVSHTTPLGEAPLAHTNHCLAPVTRAVERRRDPESQADSEARLADAERLLATNEMSAEYVMSVTADTRNICHVGAAPRFIGTCGAVAMRPAEREMWVVAGRPSEERWERFAFPVGGGE